MTSVLLLAFVSTFCIQVHGLKFSSHLACGMLGACIENSVVRWQTCTKLVNTDDLPGCWRDLKSTLSSARLTGALRQKHQWLQHCMNTTKGFSVIDTDICATMTKRLNLMYPKWLQKPVAPKFSKFKKGQALEECKAWVMQTADYCAALSPCCPQATYCGLEYTLQANSQKQASVLVLEHFKKQRACLDKTKVTEDNKEKLSTMVSTQFISK